ncbi:MAG: tetratricopeptide repeat protein [Methylococcales bacterium]|nr:tetratricopeptide repeat protein [Methylococcales bacterium]
MFEEPDIETLSKAYDRLQSVPNPDVIKLLEDLATRGSLMSMIYIAWAYENGYGVVADGNQVILWYRRAIDHGSDLATYYLGHFYLKSNDYAQAKEVFNIGALKDYSPAMYCLGCMYLEGTGCKQNRDEALKLFKKASMQGHVFARRSLAGMYLSGEYGLANIVYGLFLFFSALKNAFIMQIKDPDSDLLRA